METTRKVEKVRPKSLADFLHEDPSLTEPKTYEEMKGKFCEDDGYKPFSEHLSEAVGKVQEDSAT